MDFSQTMMMQIWFGLSLSLVCVYGQSESEPIVNDKPEIIAPVDDDPYSWFKQKYVVYIMGIIGVLLMMMTTICIVYRKCKNCKGTSDKRYNGVQLEYVEGTDDYITDVEIENQLI